MLKLIGHWSGTSEYEGDLIHPQYLRDKVSDSRDRERLVEYLKSGLLIIECMGYSFCRLPGGPPDKEMGCGYQTDGVWIWPEGLWIYVAQFGVELPDEFICHVEQNDYKIPEDLDEVALNKGGFDTTFWKEWCRRKRSERTCQS